jgi:hypothetical protein
MKQKKQRNKKYVPHSKGLSNRVYSDCYLHDLFLEITRQAVMAAEITIPNHTVSIAELASLRDTLCWFGVLLVDRDIDPEEQSYANRQQADSLDYLTELYHALKGKKTYEVDPMRLEILQDTVQLAHQTLLDALKISPRRTIKEYYVMLAIADMACGELNEIQPARVKALMNDETFMSRAVDKYRKDVLKQPRMQHRA